MTRLLKRIVGAGLLKTGLHRSILGRNGLIVAFHRIDDRYPDDPISYGVRDFTRFCHAFQDNFDVVPLAEFLDILVEGRSLEGKVALTFDDGYRDNHTTAAPILKNLGLPATFFITTGFIGSSHVAWWDRQLGVTSEWMDWSQVEELHRMGFTLGAHTMHHVDLGRAGQEEARKEIEGSRTELEDRIGARVDLFAYPYGRMEEMSEENRVLVKELGFRCSLSCFGGRVRYGDDLFRLRRTPISHWITSPGHFAFEILRP